jgi:hypothetical protein
LLRTDANGAAEGHKGHEGEQSWVEAGRHAVKWAQNLPPV